MKLGARDPVRWRLGCLLIVMLMLQDCAGHVRLTYPPSRKYHFDFLNNKGTPGPCGMPPGLDDSHTNLKAGDDLNIHWHLAQPHLGGHFFELLDANDTVKARYPQQGFLSGQNATSNNYTLSLPDAECDGCTLRMVLEARELGDVLFWSCATVNIKQDLPDADRCSGHGRINENGTCTCEKLYTGVKCQFKEECESDEDCGQHGMCVDTQATSFPKHQCYCSAGWFGPQCQHQSAVSSPPSDMSVYTSRTLSPASASDVTVHYRLVQDEVEVVMKARTASWMGFGWRPAHTQGSCKNFPDLGDDRYDMYKGHAQEQGAAEPNAAGGSKTEAGDDGGHRPTDKPGDDRRHRSTDTAGNDGSHRPTGKPGDDGRHRPTDEPGDDGRHRSTDKPGNDGRHRSTDEPDDDGKHRPTDKPGDDGRHRSTDKPGDDGSHRPTGKPGDDGEMRKGDEEGKHEREADSKEDGEMKKGDREEDNEGQERKGDREEDDEGQERKGDREEDDEGQERKGDREEDNGQERMDDGEKDDEGQEMMGHGEKDDEGPERKGDREGEGGDERRGEDAEKEGKKGANSPPKPALHPMDCTDLVIGSARGGYSRIGDYYTRDRSTPVHDEYLGGRNDLTAALVWEEGEHTFMLFRKKLTSDDPADHSLLDEQTHVLWAIGQKTSQPRYTHTPLLTAALTAHNVSFTNFYRQDELKYHGHVGQRGATTFNFYDGHPGKGPTAGRPSTDMSGKDKTHGDESGETPGGGRDKTPSNGRDKTPATYITKMTVRLADADFKETLRDTHSEDFKLLASSLITPLENHFRSQLGSKFVAVVILAFRPGSIVVDFDVVTSSTGDAAEVQQEVQTAADTLNDRTIGSYGALELQQVADTYRDERDPERTSDEDDDGSLTEVEIIVIAVVLCLLFVAVLIGVCKFMDTRRRKEKRGTMTADSSSTGSWDSGNKDSIIYGQFTGLSDTKHARTLHEVDNPAYESAMFKKVP